ncbi:MAG: tRNA 5-methoxyuridine(34)/uridine 5-oxyacetic acid(34) synthase CmoB, partial [Desulfobacterales bacterium]|nr:tRNA 5-methoxyuridine(34)/uridine 5-oxyacetic acid(34) synthase CmoB [Desulfobacterales bacterium]
IYSLPVRFDEFPVLDGFFDTVFCMGILYHSRAPLDMLGRIRRQLARDGELVLETLIMEGDADTTLCPYPRYAKMHNAYFLPTVSCLENWLRRAGFTDIRCVDVTRTTPAEQRKTDWMTFESLTDFLDPDDPTRTIEGYPAPVRAIMLARPK